MHVKGRCKPVRRNTEGKNFTLILVGLEPKEAFEPQNRKAIDSFHVLECIPNIDA